MFTNVCKPFKNKYFNKIYLLCVEDRNSDFNEETGGLSPFANSTLNFGSMLACIDQRAPDVDVLPSGN
jgi:hypothetical protein